MAFIGGKSLAEATNGERVRLGDQARSSNGDLLVPISFARRERRTMHEPPLIMVAGSLAWACKLTFDLL